MGIGKIINITSWAIDRYENVKKWWGKKRSINRENKIRKFIDADNVDAIYDIVRDIKRERRNRRDSS